MIKAYVGRLRAGKTLSLVYEGCQALEEGRKVFTNTPFIWKVKPNKKSLLKYKANPNFNVEYQALIPNYVDSGSDFLNTFLSQDNALFLIDEGSLFFSNYDWKNTPFKLIYKLTQSGKQNVDVSYTSPRWTHTITKLREIAHVAIICTNQHLFNLPFLWKGIHNDAYDPEFMELGVLDRNKPDIKRQFAIREYSKFIAGDKLKKIQRSYDTKFLINFNALTLEHI